MEITIVELLQNYGLDSVIIAVAVCILTGIIKMPIKSLADKAKDSSKYTKYITFLPLLLGFGVTALYEYIMTKTVSFTGDFIALWLASSSLSLAIYAFIEKFIPSKKKILSAEEIKQNEKMLDSLKSILMVDKPSEDAEKSMTAESEQEAAVENFAEASPDKTEIYTAGAEREKIILRGRINV